MRIVQVSPRYHPHIGGVEKYVKEVSEGLVRRGFGVEVFATDPSGKLPVEEVIDGVRVRRFKSFAPWEVAYFSNSLFYALRRVKCDVVHVHTYRALPMLLAALAKSANGAKLVVTPHLGFSKLGGPVYLVYNPIFGNIIFSKADRITLVSPAELEEVPLLRKYEEKIVVSSIGIDVDKLNKYFIQDRDSNTLNLIYAGRIERKKGLNKLIEVMAALRELDIRLTIVGEGPYARDILPIIGKMQNVDFRGRVPEQELYRLYARSNVFVLLSEYESHSVSLTEAMAFGVIPIVTNVGGNRYIVNEDVGFLVDYPVRVNEVAHLLKKLYVNREMIDKKSIIARKIALTRFNVESKLVQLEKIYENVLN